jgi:hypothetical protein
MVVSRLEKINPGAHQCKELIPFAELPWTKEA